MGDTVVLFEYKQPWLWPVNKLSHIKNLTECIKEHRAIFESNSINNVLDMG